MDYETETTVLSLLLLALVGLVFATLLYQRRH